MSLNPNWPPDLFDVAFLYLSKGKFATVDRTDLPVLTHFRWAFLVERSGVTVGYAIACINGHRVLMHRLLTNVGKSSRVDHRDRYGLNNRRGNLRVASVQQ